MFKYKYGLLQTINKHIKRGGIIAYPTESCYGFGCDPFNYKALKKILHLKGRTRIKGMICIAGNIAQINKLVTKLTAEELQQIKKYWPGFYSLILPSNAHVLKLLVGHHEKIAIRVSAHNEVKQLCDYLGIALVSTSANKSGHKSIKSYRECVRQFGSNVMVLPGMIGFAKHPSTIIDFKTMQKIR